MLMTMMWLNFFQWSGPYTVHSSRNFLGRNRLSLLFNVNIVQKLKVCAFQGRLNYSLIGYSLSGKSDVFKGQVHPKMKISPLQGLKTGNIRGRQRMENCGSPGAWPQKIFEFYVGKTQI